MGLGKTIQVLSTVLSHKRDGKQCTLIVCPVSCILQWEKEIKERINPKPASILYHGPSKPKSAHEFLKYDFVVR
jgi:SNF2 family DNA or RNA helicase